MISQQFWRGGSVRDVVSSPGNSWAPALFHKGELDVVKKESDLHCQATSSDVTDTPLDPPISWCDILIWALFNKFLVSVLLSMSSVSTAMILFIYRKRAAVMYSLLFLVRSLLKLKAEYYVIYKSKIEGNHSMRQGWCDVVVMKRSAFHYWCKGCFVHFCFSVPNYSQ